jgi:nucleosome binding factor SPN SPT16 subunit
VLTIIENSSNTWMIITVDDGLRVYSRAGEGDWSELPLGDDQEQVDPEKGFMLEELYGRESEDDGGEPDDEEEPDEEEPDLAEDEQPDDDEDEDEEPQEEPKPRRRRAAASKG